MLVFAGGGNRCYWRGGLYETIAPRHPTASGLLTN